MIKGHLYKGSQKIHFTIPESLDEVTIEQLEKLYNDLTDIELFSVLSGLDIELIKQCKSEEVIYIIDQLNGLYDFDSLNDLKDEVRSVFLGDKVFNVTTELLSMPSGQWWDVKKIEQMHRDNPINSLRHILSILLVEPNKPYDYKDVKEKYDLIGGMDVVTAFKIRNFFLNSQIVYLRSLNHSLKKNSVVKRLLRGTIKSIKNMVAYLPFTVLPKIKALLKRYLEKRKK